LGWSTHGNVSILEVDAMTAADRARFADAFIKKSNGGTHRVTWDGTGTPHAHCVGAVQYRLESEWWGWQAATAAALEALPCYHAFSASMPPEDYKEDSWCFAEPSNPKEDCPLCAAKREAGS